MTARRLLPRFLRPLARNSRGVSAIELALLAPVLSLFTVCIGDLGRAFATRYSFQQAVHRTLEMGLQSGPVSGGYTYLRAEAAAAAGVPLADVIVRDWVECTNAAGVRRREASAADCALAAGTTPAEEYARYVEIEVDCTYTPMFSGMPFVNRNRDGSVPLEAKASLRVQ